jgi:REP element-mobilizing transposase RayT
MGRPRRNDRISYVGRSTFLITVVTRDRVKAFSDIEFGRLAERALRDQAFRATFALPAYCLMPDHAHVVATGQTQDSDLRRLMDRWKQASGFAWSRLGHGRLWEEGYWDRRAI